MTLDLLVVWGNMAKSSEVSGVEYVDHPLI